MFRRFFDEALARGDALVAVGPGNGAVFGSSRDDFDRAEPGEVEIGWPVLAGGHWAVGSTSPIKVLNAKQQALWLGCYSLARAVARLIDKTEPLED
jgi:hypothetical protein